MLQNAKPDALLLALERKLPVVFAAHRADDLQTALRLAREFHLDARLDLATEGYLMADVLKKAKVPVVVHPTMQRAGATMETLHSYLGNAAVLVNPENVFEIMRAVHRVLVDKALRDKLKERSYEQSSRFSWDGSVRRILSVYEQVAGSAKLSDDSKTRPGVHSIPA